MDKADRNIEQAHPEREDAAGGSAEGADSGAEDDRIKAERDAAEFAELWRPEADTGIKPDQPRAKRALWVMMIVGIFVSAIAFAYKIAEFLFAINAEEAQGFADVPVTAYFFVAAGWIFILYWSFRSGQLRDAEKVKYDMLRQEEAYERAGQ